jgi:hypothetical protein
MDASAETPAGGGASAAAKSSRRTVAARGKTLKTGHAAETFRGRARRLAAYVVGSARAAGDRW